MGNRGAVLVLAIAAMLGCAPVPNDSSPDALAHGGDLSGVWTHSPPDYMRAYSGWAFDSSPPPMTAWGKERYDAAKPTFGPRGVMANESNDPVYDCFPPGTPRAYFHPFPIEIIQRPGRVLMIYEYHHLVRQIYTDERGHRTDLAPSWMGDSTGHWEGDTLVVETVNFNDKTWVDREGVPHSEELRVIERLRLTGKGTLEINFTIEDPVTFTAPLEAERFYRKVDWDIEEFACMERNQNAIFDAFEQQIQGYDENEN